MHYDFGVGTGGETMPLALQFIPQISEIIDFAVVRNPQTRSVLHIGMCPPGERSIIDKRREPNPT